MKKVSSVLLVWILSFSFFTQSSANAGDLPIVNQSCSKPKNNVTYLGVHYMCSFVNGKYIWKSLGKAPAAKVLVRPSAPSTPAGSDVTPTYLDGSSVSLEKLSACQLDQTVGPAKGSKNIPSEGVINIALIPIDFSNAPGTGDVQKLYSDDVLQLSNWSSKVSLGKMEYKATLAAKSWLRAPKTADWYACPECSGKGTRKQSNGDGINQLVSVADDFYDFSKFQVVIFIFPEAVTSRFGTKIYSANQEFSSSEGSFKMPFYGESPISTPDAKVIWDIIAHEILHFQGFIGHGPENGGPFGIMMNQWALSKAILSWEGFRAGWYGENEISCVGKSAIKSGFTLSLNSLDNMGTGTEGLIIPVSSEEGVVIEYRTSGAFSFLPETLTAYHLNVNKPGYRCDSCNQVVAESKNWWGYLRNPSKMAGNWKANESRSFAGVKITHLGSGRIRVTAN